MRSSRADTPAEALDDAASQWQAPDDLLLPRLAILKARTQMMAKKHGDEDWLVAFAVINKLLVDLMQEGIRTAGTADGRQEAANVIASLSRDAEGLPGNAEFARKVADSLAYVRGGA